MEEKTKRQRTAKKLDTTLTNKSDKEEMDLKGSTEEICDSSSVQLMEVSRGAQMLNDMIDSWFRGPRHVGWSEDSAKDLLKGALDLQESLVMLRKLQEASQPMTRSKAKQNEKPKRGRIDAKITDGAHNYQFNDQSYLMGFQRPRLSADGCSRNCTENLKKVIKDNLARQHLFPSTTTEVLDSASQIPSTSSSQSSGLHTDRLSVSSVSSAASKKERGPNLVAKLMGLEEFSSRPFPAAVQKQLEGENILNQNRPIFETDMPKVRKNNYIVKKVDPERKKALREILETMHFKGLLEKSSIKGPKLQIHHLSSKRCDDLPPIVLMKPRCTSFQESVKIHAPVPPLDFSRGKLKAEAVPSKTVKCKDGFTNMGKKMEEKDVNKNLTQEKGPEHLKDVVELDGKEVKLIEKAQNKAKLFSRVGHKPQLSEIDKKVKVKTISSKPAEEISKPRIVPRSGDQGEITSAKLRKPQSRSIINKDEITCQKSTALNTISKTKSQKITNSKDQRKNQMKKQRTVAKPEVAKPIVEQLGQEEENRIAVPRKQDCTEIRNVTTVADQPQIGHEVESVDTSENQIGEDCKQSQSTSGDVKLLKYEHEIDGTFAEEAHEGINCSETNNKVDKDGAELKYLLLTSQSFIGHAEELFNLDVDCPMVLQKNETDEIANLRLYLDCANELTERKSLKASQIVRLFMLTCAGNSRLNISLIRLVEEIHNAIENLKIYSEFSGQKLSVDYLYAMIERDIKCNGLINGIWDWGWGHGFSADEAEQVVSEVESQVLSGLIEEVILNL